MRRPRQSQTPDCGAPAGRSGIGVGLIFLCLFMRCPQRSRTADCGAPAGRSGVGVGLIFLSLNALAAMRTNEPRLSELVVE